MVTGVADASLKVIKTELVVFYTEIIILTIFSGETVPTNRHATNYIRVFPIDQHTPITPRNNELYDSIINMFQDEDKFSLKKKDDELKGYRGECILRELKYFDVGMSFLSDSLHNCYHGSAVGYVMMLFSIIFFFLEKNFLVTAES